MKVHIHKDGQQFGPYTVEQLREYVQRGNFTSADHACYDGQNWVTVGEVPGFAVAAQPAAAPSPTTPQPDQAVQEHAVEQQPAAANASNSPANKKKIILWMCIGGGATLLVAGLLIWLLGGDEADPESNQTSAETPPVKIVEVGWVDLDDPETLDKIIAGATVGGQLQRRSKLYYAPNQQKPYTGWHVTFHSNGQTKYLTQYKEGKWDGLWVRWFENGQKSMGSNYKDGKEDGLTTAWFENGQKRFENNYKKGKRDGLGTEWYSNGQKRAEGNFKDDKRDGLGTFWYGNGQKEAEPTFRDGKLMSAEVWKPNGEKCPETSVVDGNGVVVYYKDDGTEDYRWTYKDGKRDIESEIADLAAMGKRRETYKDGKRDGITRLWYENGQKKSEVTYKDGKLMTAVVWKPNGEKCPVTNLVNGNGVRVWYNKYDQTEDGRWIYKDGKVVSRISYPSRTAK